jgi:PIN domain nuclease of toxin-antitoxin system
MSGNDMIKPEEIQSRIYTTEKSIAMQAVSQFEITIEQQAIAQLVQIPLG